MRKIFAGGWVEEQQVARFWEKVVLEIAVEAYSIGAWRIEEVGTQDQDTYAQGIAIPCSPLDHYMLDKSHMDRGPDHVDGWGDGMNHTVVFAWGVG